MIDCLPDYGFVELVCDEAVGTTHGFGKRAATLSVVVLGVGSK